MVKNFCVFFLLMCLNFPFFTLQSLLSRFSYCLLLLLLFRSNKYKWADCCCILCLRVYCFIFNFRVCSFVVFSTEKKKNYIFHIFHEYTHTVNRIKKKIPKIALYFLLLMLPLSFKPFAF